MPRDYAAEKNQFIQLMGLEVHKYLDKHLIEYHWPRARNKSRHDLSVLIYEWPDHSWSAFVSMDKFKSMQAWIDVAETITASE